jgi:predicted metal-dependent HD superfamily phosphohydrolase
MKIEGMTLLEQEWLGLVGSWGGSAAQAHKAFADLTSRYQSADRFYHNLDHVRIVLKAVSLLVPSVPVAVTLAAWFHDAVYDPRAPDNEEKSAALAEETLAALRAPLEVREEVGRLIFLTKSHLPALDDRNGQILVDADLSILGAQEAEYDRYARAIRQEFAWVSEERYRIGRRRVLEKFLERSRIFSTEMAHSQWESAARSNLTRELSFLGP